MSTPAQLLIYNGMSQILLSRNSDGFLSVAGADILSTIQGFMCDYPRPDDRSAAKLARAFLGKDDGRGNPVYKEDGSLYEGICHYYEIHLNHRDAGMTWGVFYAARPAQDDSPVAEWVAAHKKFYSFADFCELINQEIREVNARLAERKKQSPFYEKFSELDEIEISG